MKFQKYERAMMETAFIWAEESYCKRKKVGAVISNQGRIVATGYNGTCSGADNSCEEQTNETCEKCNGSGSIDVAHGQIDCPSCLGTGKVHKTKNNVLHAEMNAISFAAKHGINTNGCTLYVTLSPCIICANLIIQAGIKEVVYREEYRITDGIEHLKSNNIKVRKYGA